MTKVLRIFKLCLILGYFQATLANNLDPAPAQAQEKSDSDKLIRAGYEKWGDMLVPSGFFSDMRAAVPETRFRWPGAKVPYVIDRSLWRHKNIIHSAMQEYHAKTCVKFVRRTNERNYIRLTSGGGCYSYIGMVRGAQVVSLGYGCVYKGTIIHELGHAIGFMHEQNRSDRDDYLRIFWNNISRGMKNQFIKLRPRDNILLDKFDYDSIMLYGERTFSRDGRRKTMVAKSGRRLVEVFDKYKLSESDIIRINTIYNCSKPI